MKRKALLNLSVLSLVTLVAGCGIEATIKRNDDRYMQPGALDAPLTNYYDTYSFRFLNQYRLTHRWPVAGDACKYRSLPTLNRVGDITGYQGDRYMGEVFAVPDIYEHSGKTWQGSNVGIPPMDFDRYVRSVTHQRPIYGPTTKEESEASVAATLERIKRSRRKGTYESPPPDKRVPIRHEEIEIGFRPLCFGSWWGTSHFLRAMLYKRDLASWQAILTERNPLGTWSERRVGANLWLVQETAEQDFGPRPLNGVGGPFQTWLLPIGDTDYTIGMELGASRESLQYPDAHARVQDTFRHLIESVKIEPMQNWQRSIK